MIALSLLILVLHFVVSLLTFLIRPLVFLRYHIVLAAIYASGILDVFEGATFTLPFGGIRLSGCIWLVSTAVMATFFALNPDALLDSRAFLIRHYRRFILLAVTIHLLFGQMSFTSVLHFLELVYPFLVLILCHRFVQTGNDREQVVRSFVWYGVALCILVPINYLVFGYAEANVLRFSRVMSTSLLPAFFVLFVIGVRRRRTWLIGAYALFLIPLMTISRGATFAIALSLVVYALGSALRIRGSSRIALALFGVCVTAGSLLLFSQFQERSLKEGSIDPLDETLVNTSGRLRLWSFFYERLSTASPVTILFGRGFGASDHFASESDPSQWFKQPHSEYLRFMFNFGLVGLLAYFGMYVRFLLRVRPQPADDPTQSCLVDAARLLLVAVAILSFYENFILYNPFGFTQNAFVLFALAMQPERTPDDPPEAPLGFHRSFS